MVLEFWVSTFSVRKSKASWLERGFGGFRFGVWVGEREEWFRVEGMRGGV